MLLVIFSIIFQYYINTILISSFNQSYGEKAHGYNKECFDEIFFSRLTYFPSKVVRHCVIKTGVYNHLIRKDGRIFSILVITRSW